MIENNLPAIVNEQTKVLIIGSMPGKQSLEKQQYYGNPRNHFWGIMSGITGEKIPENYNERLALLQKWHIGLWDSVASCERQGSLDAAIKEEQPNDFITLFQQFPQIECVLFNGGKAFTVFKKHIGFAVLQHRVYKQMPSTSPIPGKNIKSFDEKVITWKEAMQPFLSRPTTK